MESVAKSYDLRFNRIKSRLRRVWPLMLMTYPLFLLVILMSYVPLWGWSIAFVNYSPGVSVLDSAFEGLRFFRFLFNPGSDFLLSLRNTAALSSLILVTMPIPMFVALLLNEVRFMKLRRTIQTMLTRVALMSL